MNSFLSDISPGKGRSPIALALSIMLGATVMTTVNAAQIDTGDSDLKITWDNTVKYNAAWRLKDQSPILTSASNQDDGDRSLGKGLISNRINLLSEFDIAYENIGARVSGAAWYDEVYNQQSDNNSPSTFNETSVPNNQFTHAARNLHGQRGEFLDAFVFGKFDLGEKLGNTHATVRAGKHTLLWGETLFFGSNGIAGGQAPVDVEKAQSVPNTPFKELIRPVGQISGQLQINSDVSVGAYYQYDWEPNRLSAIGTYFNQTDIVGVGGERLVVGAPIIPTGGPKAFFHGNDLNGKNSGQGGLQVRFRLPNSEFDYGVYAIRYHDKTPQVYLMPSTSANINTGQIGTYALVYPENIDAYGVSATTTIGAVNLAGELSTRRNTPFVSKTETVLPIPGFLADNSDNPLYAVGNSLHVNFSALWTLSPTFLYPEGSFVGEVGWNRRLSITRNPAALDSNVTRDAWGFRMVFEPTYRQVFSGIDLGFPIGLGYNPKGKSSVVSVFNNSGVDHGGDLSIGVNGSYLDAWRFGLSYTHYLGVIGTFLDANNDKSFRQYFKDRDFISLTARRSF